MKKSVCRRVCEQFDVAAGDSWVLSVVDQTLMAVKLLINMVEKVLTAKTIFACWTSKTSVTVGTFWDDYLNKWNKVFYNPKKNQMTTGKYRHGN